MEKGREIRAREGKKARKKKISLRNDISALLHFILIRSESLIQEEINTRKGHAYQKVEITGSHFRSCLPFGARKRRHCGISKTGKNEKGPGLEKFCFGC